MIMPWLIVLVFWLGTLICIASGIYCMFIRQWNLVLPVLILGPVGLRLICEWLILAFRMNETLTDIKHLLKLREKV